MKKPKSLNKNNVFYSMHNNVRGVKKMKDLTEEKLNKYITKQSNVIKNKIDDIMNKPNMDICLKMATLITLETLLESSEELEEIL